MPRKPKFRSGAKVSRVLLDNSHATLVSYPDARVPGAPLPAGDEVRWWWSRPEGHALVLTTKQRLLVKPPGHHCFVQLRCPCDWHTGLIYACLHGYRLQSGGES